MLEYYFGRTSGGVFEDFTGDAYFVRYNDRGFNAQELVFDSSNGINKYFYYEGAFSNNIRQGSISEDNYVTPEQRDQIVEEMKLVYSVGRDLEPDFDGALL